MAIVGQSDNSGFVQRADGGEFLALHADGDAAGREDIYTGRFERPLAHECDGVGAVRGRIGVRHGQDAGETTRGRRARAAGNRLFLASTRLTQMDVHVDEAGCNDESLRVDDRYGRIFGPGRAFGDAPIHHHEIGYFIAA